MNIILETYTESVFLLFVFINSIIYHELGHWLYFRFVLKRRINFYWKNKTIQVGNEKDYQDFQPHDYMRCALLGILFGLIPIWIATQITYIAIVLYIPYTLGLKTDLQIIRENWRKAGLEN